MFEGSGKPLSEAELVRVAADIGVGLPALWAVMTVETRGCGFLPDRRPLVLFERHVFHKANNLSLCLQQGDWESFARRYNGPDFKKNRYDEKLAAEHARYVKGPLPDLTLRAAQLRLTYRGFSPGPADGWLGNRTRGALAEFQKATDIPVTGELDEATFAALETAAA